MIKNQNNAEEGTTTDIDAMVFSWAFSLLSKFLKYII